MRQRCATCSYRCDIVCVCVWAQVNTICTNRRAGDARGAIATLRSPNTPPMTVNVEYNQLDALLRYASLLHPDNVHCTVADLYRLLLFNSETPAGGDVNDPATGWSPYPGNTNQLVRHAAVGAT